MENANLQLNKFYRFNDQPSICKVIYKKDSKYLLLFKDDSTIWSNGKELTYLPYCIDFDNVSFIESKGYKLLDPEEICYQGDKYFMYDGRSEDVITNRGRTVRDAIILYESNSLSKIMGVARKVVQYRPFKDEKEFAPYKNEWFKRLGNRVGEFRVVGFDDKGIFFPNGDHYTYEEAFNISMKFLDGRPFGIINEDIITTETK